jgi:hypothetical protein
MTTTKAIELSQFASTVSVDANNNVEFSGNTNISSGTIDGVTIGGTTAAAITGTTITATGDITIPDKIVHTGDTNTSIRFPAADTVTVETDGAERFRVTSAGNVGIGTTSPAHILSVFGTGSPANSTISINRAADNTDPSYLNFKRARGTTQSSVTATQAGDSLGTILWQAANETNINTVSARIDVVQDTSSAASGSMRFGAGGSTERMRITSAGNVGIGTTSPAEQLHITGNLRVGSAVLATPSGSAPMYACRVWVNFDGSTTPPAIRASGNVSSVTRASTGRFQINFTTAMPDANFSMLSISAAQTLTSWRFVAEDLTVARVSTSASILVGRHSDSSDGGVFDYQNPTGLNLAIFR